MANVFRWIGYLVSGTVAAGLIASAVIYLASQPILDRRYPLPAVSVPAIPHDAQSIAEGERIAIVRGCTGCHDHLYGDVFADDSLLGTLVAPNLTQVLPHYSDEDLVRLLRYGLRHDGSRVYVMPSYMFHFLSDADMGRLIAYLRSVPPVTHKLPPNTFPLLTRFNTLRGVPGFEPIIEYTRDLPPYTDPGPPAVTPVYGRYLAVSVCSECHGTDLKGFPDETPDLVIAKGYSKEAFFRLMRTGVALGDRDLRLMSDVARSRFSHLSDDEVAAIYAYLQSR